MSNHDESHKLFVAVEELTKAVVVLTSAIIPDASSNTKVILQDLLVKVSKLQGIFAAQADLDIPAQRLQDIRDTLQSYMEQ